MKNVLQIALLIVVVAGIASAATEYAPTAPEVGAGAAVSAVGLLAGALLVMRARRNK